MKKDMDTLEIDMSELYNSRLCTELDIKRVDKQTIINSIAEGLMTIASLYCTPISNIFLTLYEMDKDKKIKKNLLFTKGFASDLITSVHVAKNYLENNSPRLATIEAEYKLSAEPEEEYAVGVIVTNKHIKEEFEHLYDDIIKMAMCNDVGKWVKLYGPTLEMDFINLYNTIIQMEFNFASVFFEKSAISKILLIRGKGNRVNNLKIKTPGDVTTCLYNIAKTIDEVYELITACSYTGFCAFECTNPNNSENFDDYKESLYPSESKEDDGPSIEISKNEDGEEIEDFIDE